MFKRLIIKICKILNKNKIPYMIIDGQADLLYGEPRLTRDIDITLGVGLEKLHNLLSIVKQIKLKPVPDDIENFVKKTMVLPSIDKKQLLE